MLLLVLTVSCGADERFSDGDVASTTGKASGQNKDTDVCPNGRGYVHYDVVDGYTRGQIAAQTGYDVDGELVDAMQRCMAQYTQRNQTKNIGPDSARTALKGCQLDLRNKIIAAGHNTERGSGQFIDNWRGSAYRGFECPGGPPQSGSGTCHTKLP